MQLAAGAPEQRTSYMKRALAVLMCCVLFLYITMPQRRAKAVAFVAAAPVAAELLMHIAISCGVTLMVKEGYDTVVGNIWVKLTPEMQEKLKRSVNKNSDNGGKEVVGGESGIHKYVVDVADDLWQAIKAAVDGLYDVGTNTIADENMEYLTLSSGSIVHNVNGESILPLAVLFDGSVNKQVFRADGTTLYIDNYSTATGQIFRTDTHTGIYKVVHVVEENGSIILKYYDANNSQKGGQSITGNIGIVHQTVINATVEGNSDAIDNAEYVWPGNNYTGQKQIVLTPGTDTYGNISFDTEGYPQVDADQAATNAVGVTANDIAARDPTGIQYMEPETIINEPTVDTPTSPSVGTEEQTSMRALLFCKFPFCLPWDIKNAFALLISNPVPPEWEIDLVPQSIKARCGITADTKWKINMDDFEVVGQVSRWTSTIGFCLALMVLTRRIIKS